MNAGNVTQKNFRRNNMENFNFARACLSLLFAFLIYVLVSVIALVITVYKISFMTCVLTVAAIGIFINGGLE
jgi:protein-S-isoprenylcysteine O-methyltransferase Ste14